MENYEQKYKEALERAKYLKENTDSVGAKDISYNFEYIFPELKESEDERIRKDILKHLNETMKDGILIPQQWIAWLEKQGEQNPTDKVEPKFMIGDTIHKIGENTIFPRVIKKIEDGYYVCNNSHSFINIKFQDDYELVEQKPAWSEEDEKMLNSIIEEIRPFGECPDYPTDEDREYYYGRTKMIDWLKSLKPNHWKPSEQNIKDLEWCADLVKDKMGVGFHRLQVFIDKLKSL